MRWFIVVLLLALAGCAAPPKPPPCPPSGAIAGVIQGYDTSQGRTTQINIWKAREGPGGQVVIKLFEGTKVWIVERIGSDVRIMMQDCRLQGWVDSEFVK